MTRLPIAIIVFAFMAVGLAMLAYQVNRANFGAGSTRENVALVMAAMCVLIAAGLAGALTYRNLFT